MAYTRNCLFGIPAEIWSQYLEEIPLGEIFVSIPGQRLVLYIREDKQPYIKVTETKQVRLLAEEPTHPTVLEWDEVDPDEIVGLLKIPGQAN